MENELFLNAGIAAPPMPTWHSAMADLNCSSEQSSDCFINPNWERSTDHNNVQFDSALSSMVSSPVASNSNMSNSNESFVIRELIGKLGNIGNSNDLPPPYNNSTNTSCYTTPSNSPPPIMDHLLKEKLPTLGSSVAEFSADPGFAERAARFSRFGSSRSFNGRATTHFAPNNPEEFGLIRSNHQLMTMMANEKLPRVSSSPSLQLANSQEESSVSEQVPIVLNNSIDFHSKKRKAASKGKAKEPATSPSTTKVDKANENSNNNNKRCKPNDEGNGNENNNVKTEEESKGGDANKTSTATTTTNSKPPEPPKDYIHVRARRGQATDSHSLAERVRREKISERMKLLQDLVPGCNKVTGKALMLDEIINYVQSLQRQVEFLSMKLASVNTRLDINVDSLMSKDMYHPNKGLAHPIFPVDSSASVFLGQQQNPGLQSNISNGTITQCLVDPLDSALYRNLNIQLSQFEQFAQILPQFQSFCEDDLQSIVQMGFGQNPNRETAAEQSQSYHGN
ncbi:hypothetical protein Dsin_030094 [Dipteronia sinensis]|uniref:BHLH domain-containing protein n=1 Tax=Dipteronia sinensis TaxID=43782 RepID=A0AAE0DQQ2_9ROSI|nr:hypothetical protein Dsin_030094 [Dipteronia sinensis]